MICLGCSLVIIDLSGKLQNEMNPSALRGKGNDRGSEEAGATTRTGLVDNGGARVLFQSTVNTASQDHVIFFSTLFGKFCFLKEFSNGFGSTPTNILSETSTNNKQIDKGRPFTFSSYLSLLQWIHFVGAPVLRDPILIPFLLQTKHNQ